MNNLFDIYKKIVLDILDNIDFKEDKENFAEQFLITTQELAFLDLINTLAEQQRIEIEQKITAYKQNPEKVIIILKTYFPQEQIYQVLQSAFEKGIKEWMQAIEASLSNSQLENLSI